MSAANTIRTMCAQHDELRALAHRYRIELGKRGPDLRNLSECRWRLLRLVTVHLAFEDAHLQSFLAEQRTSKAFDRADLDGLRDRFQNHVREWTSDRIVSEWPTFCRQASARLDELGVRMEREERDVYAPALLAKVA